MGAARLSLGSGDANAGGLAAVPLMLQSDAPVAALQADVVVSPAVASIFVPPAALGGHVAESAQIGSNAFRVIVYSLFNQPLANGAVLSLQASVAPSFTSGEVTLDLANVILASPSAAEIQGVALAGGRVRVGGGAVVRLEAVTLTASGALRFEVSGLSGPSFVLEQSADLQSWTEAETIAAQGATATVSRNIAAGAGAQFYRVRQR